MSTLLRIIVVVAGLGLILGGLFAWRMHQISQQQQAMSQPPPPADVHVIEAARERWPRSVTAIGSLRAVNGIRVANEFAGVVESVEFESGQSVKAGDVLIRLDAEIDEAALETRQAEARLALQQFERFSNLIRQNAVSQSDFDEARSNYEAAQARVHEQQALLDKKTIRAPFSGVLGLRLIDLGQYLAAGTSIVGINMLDPIQVDFTLSERNVPSVEAGDRVEVDVAAYPAETFEGRIQALDSAVLPETRTVRVRAQLDNADMKLRPGMFATVRTFEEQQKTVVTVPRTAISYNTYGDFVFAVVEGEDDQIIVQRINVDTGEVRNGQVELLEGIEAGTAVVRDGLLRLRNEQPVNVVSESRQEASSQ
ncbi:MAG: efflux RND transporter periplasmic adaptor subunit [Xanthomonadaceae bacterium]|nr:efflux RND transporter periplasmic adaptor subunit [Xanthomonadaceae bacterium]